MPAPTVRRSTIRSAVAFAAVLALSAWSCFYSFELPDAAAEVDAATLDAEGKPCAPELPCPDGSSCTYEDRRCGQLHIGACANTPTDCKVDPVGARYCACDHQSYESACHLRRAGTDFSGETCDRSDPSRFECGYIRCPKDTYCREVLSTCDANCSKTDFACIPFSASCTSKSCSCLDVSDGCSCSARAGGTLHVACKTL